MLSDWFKTQERGVEVEGKVREKGEGEGKEHLRRWKETEWRRVEGGGNRLVEERRKA